MTKELISIILPTYNRGYIIQKAIDSVLVQNYEYWELIIVDDGSTDETDEVVRRYHDERIRYVKNETNMGANYARNRGVELAKGKYLTFIDSDNVWEEQKLSILLKEIQKNSNIRLVFGQILTTDLCGNRILAPENGFQTKDLWRTINERNVIDTNAALISRETFLEVGGFDICLKRLQDWDLFYRVIQKFVDNVKYVEKVVSYNYIQKNSISNVIEGDKAYLDFRIKHYNRMELENKNLFFEWIYEVLQQKKMDTVYIASEICRNRKLVEDILLKYVFAETGLRKYSNLYVSLLEWKQNMDSSESMSTFDNAREILKNKKIAIYGLGDWGRLIYKELSRIGLAVSCGIDREKKEFFGLPVYRYDEIPRDVEIVIISLVYDEEKIINDLQLYYDKTIFCIKEILNMKKRDNLYIKKFMEIY